MRIALALILVALLVGLLFPKKIVPPNVAPVADESVSVLPLAKKPTETFSKPAAREVSVSQLRSLVAEGRTEEAIEKGRAVEVSSVEILREVALIEARVAKRPNQAIKFLKQAVAQSPSVRPLLATIGELLLEEGNSLEAKEYLESQLGDGGPLSAYTQLGHAQMKERDFTKAFHAYDYAYQGLLQEAGTDPVLADSLAETAIDRGFALHALGRREEARKMLSEAEAVFGKAYPPVAALARVMDAP